MNAELISRFRSKVNENGFCSLKYRDVNGKNKWNCICSAMDWITVAVDSIHFEHELSPFHSNQGSIEILDLVMRVALIKESVEQLHRVFYNTKEIYLNSDRSVFVQNEFSATDNEYFEFIRACFGAHPVNLKGFTKYNDSELFRYASWSFGSYDGFSVILYPQSASGKQFQ